MQTQTQAQWTDCNIIVKQLSAGTDTAALDALFGRIASAAVKMKATHTFGYVQSASQAGAEQAMTVSQAGQLELRGQAVAAE